MIKRLFPTSEFTKNIFTLLTGTTLAQLLAIAAYPILTRLFTPEDFGVFALYLGITGIASIAISGRYELAVMLPKNDDDSIHIVLGSVLIAFISSIGLFIFFYFSNTYIANLLNSPKLADWILLMPIPIFMIGTYKSINNWLIRKKAFKKSSVNKFAQSGTYASGGISLGWFNISGGLIIADILAKVAINIVGTIQMFNTQFTLRQISIAKIKENIIRYSDFPKYNIIPALMDTGSLMIPYFFINSFYSEEITGYVNLTKQIAYAPLALISISVSRVLFETLASKKNNSEPVFKYVISLFYRLGGIALLYVIVIVLFGPKLFSFIFGNDWEQAGGFAQILAIAFAFKFIISPLSVVFPALEKIKIGSLWQAFNFFAICLLYFVQDLTINEFLLVYAGIEVVTYFVYFALIVMVSKRFDGKLVIDNQSNSLTN